jgi:hypothetical protein
MLHSSVGALTMLHFKWVQTDWLQLSRGRKSLK